MIRKSTNLLLTRTLSNCLQNVIKRKNVGLTEVGHGLEVIRGVRKGLVLRTPYGTFRGAGVEPYSEVFGWETTMEPHSVAVQSKNALYCAEEDFVLLLLALSIF